MPSFDDPTLLFDDPTLLFDLDETIDPPPIDPVDPPPPATTGALWAASLNGVTIGVEPYGFWGPAGPQILGWTGMRTSDQDRSSDHGSISANPDFLPTSNKDIAFYINCRTELEALEAYRALATAWSKTETIQMLDLSTPMGHFVLFGRPRRLDPILDNVADGEITGKVRFEATDPRFYSDAHTIIGNLAATTGGLSLPHGFPHGFGTANAGGVALTNDGNTSTNRILAVLTAGASALVSPVLELVTTGEKLLFNLTLPAGSSLYVDFAAKTVKLNNQASRGGSVSRPESDWWRLPPGAHQLRFGGAGGGAEISVTYRSASIL